MDIKYDDNEPRLQRELRTLRRQMWERRDNLLRLAEHCCSLQIKGIIPYRQYALLDNEFCASTVRETGTACRTLNELFILVTEIEAALNMSAPQELLVADQKIGLDIQKHAGQRIMWRTRIQSVPQSGGETHSDIDARLQILKSEHAMVVDDYDRIKSAYNSLPANFMEQRCTNRAAEASKLHDAFATGCQTQYCDCQVKRTRTFNPELPFKKIKNALEDAERSLSFGGLSSASDQLAIAKHEMEFAQGQIMTLKEEIGNVLKEDDSFVWPWVYKKATDEPDYTACPYVLKSIDTPTNIWD